MQGVKLLYQIYQAKGNKIFKHPNDFLTAQPQTRLAGAFAEVQAITQSPGGVTPRKFNNTALSTGASPVRSPDPRRDISPENNFGVPDITKMPLKDA